MMNPPYAPRPQSVEIKVSYGVRIGCMSALAAPFLLVAIWAVVGSFLLGPKSKAVASCDGLVGSVTCTDETYATGKTFHWTVEDAGNYKVSLGKLAGSTRELRLSKGDGTKLQAVTSKPGADVVISAKLTPGEYVIGLFDTPPAGGKAIAISAIKDGAKPQKKRAEAAPVMSEQSVSIAAVLFLGGLTILVAVPLIFAAEKKRIPLRLDPNGVTMRDGQVLPWSEYQSFRPHVLISRGSRYEREIGFQLIFARRTAEIVYRPVRNLAEVKPIIEALRQKRNPWI